jgi:hypothetical protein
LRPIAGSFAGMLNLRGYRSYPRIARYRQFRSGGPRIDSSAPAVVTDPVAAVIRHRIIVHISDGLGIHIRNRTVVINDTVVPIGAIITAARISIAVVDAAIEANVRTPVSCVPQISAVFISPPRRRPERTHPGSHYPGAGNPVITGIRIIPIPGRPNVIVPGTWRLAVIGKGRRRFRSFDRLLVRARGGSRFRVIVRLIVSLGNWSRRIADLAHRRQVSVCRISIGDIGSLILRFIAGRQAREN